MPEATQQSQQPDPQGTQVTLDEIEASIKAQDEASTKPDLSKITVDIDTLPDHLKGKSVTEVLDYTKKLEDSLKLSEQARERATQQPQQQTVVVQQQPSVEQKPQQLTREQVAEMMQNDPMAAFEYMQNQSARLIEQNVEARLRPLREGTASAAEQNARQRYSEEFQLLGKEIDDVISKLPDKSALAMPGAWDDLINYVRGANIDKVIDHKVKKREEEARRTAQQVAQSHAPANLTATSTRAPAPVGATTIALDDTKKEIAKNLGMTLEEYTKWSQV